MAYTVAQHGHVWSLVIYYDELTPGDAFAPDNKRKFWSIYVAFLEFGPHMLAQEEAWLPIGILRTSTAKTIVGGMPNATRLLLGSWCGHPIMLKFNSVLGNSASSSFGNSASSSFGNSVLDNTVDEGELISVGIVINLADLDAHRAISGWLGTSGLRPCTKCRNVKLLTSY